MRRLECCNRPETAAGWTTAFNKRLFCRKCRRCLRHEGCGCKQCPTCMAKDAPKAMCPRCGSCKQHHQEKVFRRGEFPFRECQLEQSTRTTFALNPLQRSLGVEVELEQFNGLNQRDCKYIKFHIEHDGSVRGSGQELVTAKLCGDAFITGMTDLGRAIANKNCVAGPSTGLHVHVDAIDYNTLDLRRAFVLFALIQHDLFGTLVAEDRRENQYCPPLRGSKKELANLIKLVKPEDINRFFYKYLYNVEPPDLSVMSHAEATQYITSINRQIADFKTKKYMNAARRQALNFHSWMMRGTLEFRLHEGTTNFEDLLMWPLWCGWFVQRVLGISDKEVEYWVHKGAPSVLALSERFAEGNTAMPKNVLEWARRKCSGKASPKAKADTDGMEDIIRFRDEIVAQERAAAQNAYAQIRAQQEAQNRWPWNVVDAYNVEGRD